MSARAAPATTPVGPYLRATVVAHRRAVDVVLPTGAPVAALMPALLELTQLPATGAACVLHTPEGHTVPAEPALRDAGLRDGVVLHLVAEPEAPPEPRVADLIDVVEHTDPGASWAPVPRAWTLAGLGVLLVLVGAGLWSRAPGVEPLLVLGSATAGLLAVSVVGALCGVAPVAWSTAAGGAASGAGCVLVVDVTPAGRVALGVLVLLGTIAATAWCSGRWCGAMVSAGTVALVALAGAASWSMSADPLVVGATTLTVTTVLMGLVPRVALGAAGVFSLDARIARGEDIRAADARDRVLVAHAVVLETVAVCSLSFAVSGYALGLGAGANRWALGLSVVTLAGWVARGRHFPMTAQRALIGVASVAVLAALAQGLGTAGTLSAPWAAVGCLALGVLVAVTSLRQASPLSGAVMRRWTQRCETVCVAATLPLLIGLLGVYDDLVTTW